MLIEVRWHGRGGQGVVTASDLLARASILEGKYVQHFPEFGPERRGAPVRAYTRISDEPIEVHCAVYNPDYVVVIDPTLVSNVSYIMDGVKEGGTVIVNSTKEGVPKELVEEVRKRKCRLYYVDATKIALDIFGRELFNTPMLGAFVKVSGIVKLDSVLKALEIRFSGEILKKNVEAVRRAYEEVKPYE